MYDARLREVVLCRSIRIIDMWLEPSLVRFLIAKGNCLTWKLGN